MQLFVHIVRAHTSSFLYQCTIVSQWHNTFDRNLACKNSRHQVEAQWTRSDIAEPALFLISNPQNTYTNNVAAGSVAHGFWFELLPHVLGESALLAINAGVVPRHLGLIPGGFAGNVAHSCSQDGITSQGNGRSNFARGLRSHMPYSPSLNPLFVHTFQPTSSRLGGFHQM